ARVRLRPHPRPPRVMLDVRKLLYVAREGFVSLSSVLLPLVLASAMAAAGNEWPAKGDTIYVASSFKKLTAASPVAGAQMSYDMPPCAALVVTKAASKKSEWVTKDPVGGTETLRGAWLGRMHKAKTDCEAQHAKDGDPNFTQSGSTFTLA